MRAFPLWKERVSLQVIGEAFNLFNHTNISSVNGTAFNYANAVAGSSTCPTSLYTGCLTPNATFLSPTSSSSTNGLYAARQLQFSAKVVF
jgi:hypothetical protein